MKKTIVVFLILSMLLISTGFTNAEGLEEPLNIANAVEKVKDEYKDEYYKMDSSQISLELQRISQNYLSPGDVLSERDSAIIILDRFESEHKPVPMAGQSSQWYDIYKTQYGVKVNLYGTIKQNIAYVAGSSTFGGTGTVNIMSGSVKKVSIAIHHTAYGLIGTSAPFVGVLYNGKVSMSNSGNNKYTRMDKNSNYGSILPVYTTMYATAEITNSVGNVFDVYSSTWTRWH